MHLSYQISAKNASAESFTYAKTLQFFAVERVVTWTYGNVRERLNLFARCCAAVDVRLKEKTVADMIELMCAKGIFDAGLYEKYGILTSPEIQETYREVKCSHGRAVTVKRKYWLNPENASANLAFEEDLQENRGEIPTEKAIFSTEKPEIPTENALKESKEKKRKVK